MSIIGYGEDSLTLLLLSNTSMMRDFFIDISQYVDENIESAMSDNLLFYRPSFGRAGGKKNQPFGEFDAIIVTKKQIYLIESKWNYYDESNTIISDKKINPDDLDGSQVTRHTIFNFIHKNWKSFTKNDIAIREVLVSKFIEETGKDREAFPAENTVLFRNIKYIISMINDFSPNGTCQNVYVSFYPNTHSGKGIFVKKHKNSSDNGFLTVLIGYESCNNWKTAHLKIDI